MLTFMSLLCWSASDVKLILKQCIWGNYAWICVESQEIPAIGKQDWDELMDICKILEGKTDLQKLCNAKCTGHDVFRVYVKVLTESTSTALFPRRKIKCYGPCSVHVTQRKSKTYTLLLLGCFFFFQTPKEWHFASMNNQDPNQIRTCSFIFSHMYIHIFTHTSFLRVL